MFSNQQQLWAGRFLISFSNINKHFIFNQHFYGQTNNKIPAFANASTLAASLDRPYLQMDNLKYQTGLKRLGAAIVDGIVFMPLFLIEQWLFGKTNNISILITWTILTTFLYLFYSIFAHYKYGQTIGKWVAGVKVLDVSETRKLTLRQSLLRDLFYWAIEIIGLLYFSFLIFQTGKTEYIFEDYRNFVDQPILWWTLLELVSMLTNSKRRAVHDFLAKSVVIRT